MPVVKRYAPFAAVVLAQLVLVGVAPSKGRPAPAPTFAETGTVAQTPVGAGSTAPTAVAGGAPAATAPLPTSRGPVSAPAAGTPVQGSASTAVRGGAAVASQDRSRCAGAAQFADYAQAPPCVPHTGNPGATFQGVTAKTIKVVYFREKDNPVVKGLLQKQGIYSDPADQRRFMAAMETFINARYELYGRKVQIAFWSSPCEAAPPKPQCFRDDAKKLVAQEKPFAVMYDNNTNTPAFFDELSAAHVINFGGWHFQDSFSTSHRPYHYDALMGGDAQARLTGEYWCERLAGKKARFAGSADLQAKVRKVGLFYPQTEVNTEPAQRLGSIIKGCGTDVVYVPYSPDTATASSQASSQVAQAHNAGVTSVLYFADPIAPAFGTAAMTTQNWYPEHVLVGSGLIDYDALARLYDQGQWAHAFGPSDTVVYRPFSQQECSIVWRASGQTGNPYASAELPWSYLSLIAAGLQMAGPTLDPGSFERALLSGAIDTPPYRTLKRPDVSWVHFGTGDYTASSDAKEAYWDPTGTSRIDGQQGTYVALNGGRRYRPGEWPAGEPVLPAGV